MTNATIILKESLRLLQEGVINTTGRMLQTEDGQKVPEPEPIHTFQAWKELGYSVKKGEKAVAKFPIWKYKTKKVEVEGEEKETSDMFMKTAAFFTKAQVEPITQGH